MAEIYAERVTRAKQTNWLWIVLAIIVVAAIILAYAANR
jgi:bacteriorhodopsin